MVWNFTANTPKALGQGIKMVATLFISAALGLELCYRLGVEISWIPSDLLPVALLFGRLALISHGVEGMIAAFSAPSRRRSALKSAVYTFFVGTIGLMELFEIPTASDTPVSDPEI